MTATQDATIAELQRTIAELRREREAGLAREATLAEGLAARDAALAQRNTQYSERIEYQAATVDVLKVMSASPGEAQPVFDLIVRQAKELCNCMGGALYEYDGELVHLRTNYGGDTDAATVAKYIAMFPMAPTRASFACRAIMDREVVHIRDTDAEPEQFAVMRDLERKAQISVPLLRDGVAIGAIALGAEKAGGFSDSQVALLQTFAEQAVIAITSAETYRALQTRTADLQESLEYQTATSDVLKVISRSTFDLQPVLDTVVETAARLCNAEMAAIVRPDGDLWRLGANCGFPSEFEAYQRARGAYPLDPTSPTVLARAICERRTVHIHDVAADPGYPDALIRLGKQRTSLGVPLLRDGATIGVLLLARQRVEPFTDRQIDLVSTFADQAVIAIENTRLLTEQREALEQQTATAEVLQVINASPGNLTPVFEAILNKAHALCGADLGSLTSYDGERFNRLATHGYPPEYEALVRARIESTPLRSDLQVNNTSVTGPSRKPLPHLQRLLDGARLVHDADVTMPSDLDDPVRRAAVEIVGIRTALFVPLRKDGRLLGYIGAQRREVRQFSEKEIALLENFAVQAVIAMENARLINEQREALEQQTATAEVLQVINSSPGNLAPVFDAVLEKAMRLCGAAFGSFYTRDGEQFHSAAQRGVPAAYAEFRAHNPPRPIPGSTFARALETRRTHQILDLKTEEPYLDGNPNTRAMVELGGVRTILSVPLCKDYVVLGHINVYRQEVRAFSEKQIALLENFAAQAVIAMENARLLGELRERTEALAQRNSEFGERIEQQSATIDVLKVMSSTPDDTQPVFELIVRRAQELCKGVGASLFELEGNLVHFRAAHSPAPHILADPAAREAYMALFPMVPTLGSLSCRAILEKQVVHIRDVQADPGLSQIVRAANSDIRSHLTVPLMRDGQAIGSISLRGEESGGFTDSQVALLQTFAEQAVIAIGSVANFRALRERTAELAQRQAELRVTFENMGDGVAMFDETQHLAAWNRKFQDILDVPDDIIARRQTFSEYVRYLAERDEYGAEADPAEHVRGLIEQTGQSRTYERTRPDGRVIEIRHNPVAGGGFVLIYADITERKRNEAEIRAARDAAEEASRTIEAAYRDLKAAQANLIQAEKMASLGQLTAGIAHEIKNPLNFVNNFAALSVDLLSELKETAAPAFAALTDDQSADINDVSAMLTSNLEKITEHGKRADGIVKAMLEHSRGSSAERRMVDLNAVIDEALNLAYHGARAQDQSFNITLERDFGEGIAPIEVNPQDMTRVFLNIFSNGFYAATGRVRNGGDAGFEPTLKVTTRNTGDAVEIRVRDNGTGIQADIRDKLFQPFFTTKPTGEGTGLGLSITYDIVTKAHGGSIAVDSKVGDFSEFTIRLPRNL